MSKCVSSGWLLRVAAQASAAAFVGAVALQAAAQPPRRDLTVEVRVIDAAVGGGGDEVGSVSPPSSVTGTTVSSRSARVGPPQTQSLRILNGTRGTLRFSRSLPFEWVQAAAKVPSRSASGGTSGGSAGGSGGAVVNAMTWLQAGHALSLLPRWPGGGAPVTVTIELEVAEVGDPVGAEMPPVSSEHYGTTVVAPLGRWTTFAEVGAASDSDDRHSWSTAAVRTSGRQLFQVRVLAPRP